MEAWSRLGNTDDLAHENSHRGQWREGGLARSFLQVRTRLDFLAFSLLTSYVSICAV